MLGQIQVRFLFLARLFIVVMCSVRRHIIFWPLLFVIITTIVLMALTVLRYNLSTIKLIHFSVAFSSF